MKLSSTERIAAKFCEIFLSIWAIQKYTKGISDEDFFADERTQDAVDMRFINIGEGAVSIEKFDKEFIIKHGHIPWKKMRDFRNVIAHDYFGINLPRIWGTITDDIPALENDLYQVLCVETEIKDIVIEYIQDFSDKVQKEDIEYILNKITLAEQAHKK